MAMTTSFTHAQKVAFADVNAILSVMPENERINEDLKIYATGLQKRLDDKKAQLEQLSQQFQQALAAKDTARALEIQQQAIQGDKELQQTQQQSEQQLAQKRNELLEPVLDKIGTAMEAVAKKEGFDYVLNSTDGSGTSILLWGPDGVNISRKVVEELGVKLEAQQPAEPAKEGKKKKK